jgi:hypothetical protein
MVSLVIARAIGSPRIPGRTERRTIPVLVVVAVGVGNDHIPALVAELLTTETLRLCVVLGAAHGAHRRGEVGDSSAGDVNSVVVVVADLGVRSKSQF